MKKTVLLAMLLVACSGIAQRYEVLSGNLESLGGIKEYNVTFDYKGLQVNGFDSEEAYLKEKIEKRQGYNGGKDIHNKAQKFEDNWYADREDKYEPAFISYFNERFENREIRVAKNPAAKYTMNVKSTWVYPGYEVANVEPAKLSAIITVSETTNPENVIVVIRFDKVIGIVNDYRQQGDRIKGAYERLAKNLTIQLKRFL